MIFIQRKAQFSLFISTAVVKNVSEDIGFREVKAFTGTSKV